MRRWVSIAPLLVAIALIAGACGGGDGDGGTTAATGPTASAAVTGPTAPSCPPAEAGGFSGPTSEGLCVGFGLDGSQITGFELELMTSCTLGFGESDLQLIGDGETITSSEAAFNAGTPFAATVKVDGPVEVDADGSFSAGSLAGTITGGTAEGTYELDFSGAMIEDFTCSGGPVTWTATQSPAG